jgi:hypothetical protein
MISITSLTFNPNPINLNAPSSSLSTGKVTLSGPAPAGTTVTLTSSDDDSLNVPVGIRISRGSDFGTFQAQGAAGPRTSKTVQVTATFAASGQEISEAVASVTIIGLELT